MLVCVVMPNHILMKGETAGFFFEQFKIAQGNDKSVLGLVGTYNRVFIHPFQQDMNDYSPQCTTL
jgi:hypothetical protein